MAPAEENLMIEQNAKFEGLKELIEDDMEDTDIDEAGFDNIATNLPELKQQYLSLRVAQAKYKSRFVPSAVSDTVFNASESPYKYNDPYLDSIKKDYQRVNKTAVAFLKRGNPSDNANEQKVTVTDTDEIERILAKVRLEASQVKNSLDDTFNKLQNIVTINPSQAQIYKDLKTDLIQVIDQRIPGLITQVTALAGPAELENIRKINAEFSSFENTEKTRLYELVQVIAQKTTGGSGGSRPASSSTPEES